MTFPLSFVCYTCVLLTEQCALVDDGLSASLDRQSVRPVGNQ